MTVFLCAKCSAELTPDLTALPAVPDVPANPPREKGQVAPSTVPQGWYAIEPEPWGAPFVRRQDQHPAQCHARGPTLSDPSGFLASAGPRHMVIVNPDDVPSLRPLPGNENSVGCCGPDGIYGRNRACRCGTAIATLTADCMGPYELHLDPLRVFPLG